MKRCPRLFVTSLESRTTPSIVTATGADPGSPGTVIASDVNHKELLRVSPYGTSFTGGVRVVLADVNGDGELDLITAPGEGTAPTVKIYDGVTLQLLQSFDVYELSFLGGVNLAAADLNGDGKAEVITGADFGGGPRVRVLDGLSVSEGNPVAIVDFIAIDDANFRGGVRIAVGDLTGDGIPDLVVGAGKGGGPRIAGFDGASIGKGKTVKFFADFFSFDSGLRDGSVVQIKDVNQDGTNDLVFRSSNPTSMNDRWINGQNRVFINWQNDGSIEFQNHPAYEFALANPGGTQFLDGQWHDQLIPIITSQTV